MPCGGHNLVSNGPSWAPVPLADLLVGMGLRAFTGLDPNMTVHSRSTWARLAEVVAAVLDEAPTPPLPKGHATAADLYHRYRDGLGAVDPREALPLLFDGRNWLLVDEPVRMRLELRSDLRPGYPIRRHHVCGNSWLGGAWFSPLVSTLVEGLELPRTRASSRLMARLAEGPIQGRGRLGGYSLRRVGMELDLSLDVGPPFLMEVRPGAWILWSERVRVAVRGRPSQITDLVMPEVRAYSDRQPVPEGIRRSPTTTHPYVHGSRRQICMADTATRYRKAREGRSELALLEEERRQVLDLMRGRLVAAKRVLRYGWRRSNRSRPWPENNPRYRLDHAGLAQGDVESHPRPHLALPWDLLSTAEAEEIVAASPETEMVRWAQ